MWGLELGRYGSEKMRKDARGGGDWGGVERGDKVKSSGGNWRLT